MTRPQEIKIPLSDVTLDGLLTIPDNSIGLVIFAHGSGSSRFSRRNNFVARSLNDRGFATLLFDLLTTDEEHIDEQTRQYRFDIPMLANRLKMTTRWMTEQDLLSDVPIAYFGASTGAAAALIAAADLGGIVTAVISRGGRPDLAAEALERVQAPVLLIVGGRDEDVLELNELARTAMRQSKVDLTVVPGATHLFEEAGALEKVAEIAGSWLQHQSERRNHATSKALGAKPGKPQEPVPGKL